MSEVSECEAELREINYFKALALSIKQEANNLAGKNEVSDMHREELWQTGSDMQVAYRDLTLTSTINHGGIYPSITAAEKRLTQLQLVYGIITR